MGWNGEGIEVRSRSVAYGEVGGGEGNGIEVR